jgi:hypothetical protein
VAGAGVTLQGPGFDVAQNEIALFTLYVNSSTAVSVFRSNMGDSTGETLAETLVFGNVTGGTDIVITAGDAITGAGQVPVISSQVAADAVRIQASNAAGGIDVDSGTGGTTVDSTGAISVDAAAASNFSTTTGALTLASTDATAVGQVVVSSAGTGVAAVDVNATGGGITVDYAAGSTMPVASGGTVIATFGTAVAPDLTVNNGSLVFSTVSRGIQNGPTDGTIAANAVTVNGTAGRITDSGAVASGARTQIAVTNTSVVAASQIFIQVGNDATAAQSASLLTNVIAGVGSFTLDVFNTDGANATTGTPVYNYLVINPA